MSAGGRLRPSYVLYECFISSKTSVQPQEKSFLPKPHAYIKMLYLGLQAWEVHEHILPSYGRNVSGIYFIFQKSFKIPI